MMSRHRALTLLELLAALVLLTILVGACVPLIQRAMRALETTEPEFELLELARFADAFIDDPSDFSLQDIPGQERLELAWPQHLQRPPITLHRVTPDQPEGGWIAFSCGGWTVHRWASGDEDPGAEPAP